MRKTITHLALFALVFALMTSGFAYAAAWMQISEATETYTVAANADGTRFLMAEAHNYVGDALASRAYLIGADGSGETALVLADTDVGKPVADRLLATLGISAEAGAAIIDESGEAGFVMMFLPWRDARMTAVAGNSMLVSFPQSGVYALIDALSGETFALTADAAMLGSDGRVGLRDWMGVCSIFDPADGSAVPFAFDDADEWSALSILPLSDGGVMAMCIPTKPSDNFPFACYALDIGPDGGVRWHLSTGIDPADYKADAFYYSEAAQTGIIWGENEEMLRPLVFRAVKAESNTPLYENTENALLPLGLSQDGKCVLVCDRGAGDLYLLDLETMALDQVATDAELAALFVTRGIDYAHAETLASFSWNGNDVLIGWYGAPGGAIRLGIE